MYLTPQGLAFVAELEQKRAGSVSRHAIAKAGAK